MSAKRLIRARRVKRTQSGAQERYTRGCMLLLFHKSRYEHYSAPCISDAEFDRLERHVEELEQQKGVKKHPDAPTHKLPCPFVEDLPRTVREWLKRFDRTGVPPAMPKDIGCSHGNEKSGLKQARRVSRPSRLKKATRRRL